MATAASWSEVISSVQMDHAKIEAQRRDVESECTAIRAGLAAVDNSLEQLAQQAAAIAKSLVHWDVDTGRSSAPSLAVMQRRQQSAVQRAGVLAQEIVRARKRIWDLVENIASSTHIAQKQIPRVWDKASGTIESTSTTLASTEQRMVELKNLHLKLSHGQKSKRQAIDTLKQNVEAEAARIAHKRLALERLQTSLVQAQSTSAELVERLESLNPDVYVESLSSDHDQRASTVRKLQSRIASVKSETSRMERRISTLAGA